MTTSEASRLGGWTALCRYAPELAADEAPIGEQTRMYVIDLFGLPISAIVLRYFECACWQSVPMIAASGEWERCMLAVSSRIMCSNLLGAITAAKGAGHIEMAVAIFHESRAIHSKKVCVDHPKQAIGNVITSNMTVAVLDGQPKPDAKLLADLLVAATELNNQPAVHSILFRNIMPEDVIATCIALADDYNDQMIWGMLAGANRRRKRDIAKRVAAARTLINSSVCAATHQAIEASFYAQQATVSASLARSAVDRARSVAAAMLEAASPDGPFQVVSRRRRMGVPRTPEGSGGVCRGGP